MVSAPVAAPAAPPDEDAGVSPARTRRWPRRLLIGLNIAAALCLVAAASAFAYVKYQFRQIKRIDVPVLAAQARRNPGGGAVPDGPGAPTTILVVGSDTRAFVKNAAQAKAFGNAAQTAGQRSDTIMLVHLDPRARTVSLLSVPRDLWVPIADTGYKQRINTAFDAGPDVLVRTVQDNLGIAINHYVEVDFQSFQEVVNALGGVKFWYPEPVRDSYSGLNITTPGCYTLSGDMALGLVRARHLQYYDKGYWKFESESDLARIRRQQSFVKKVVSKAQDQGFGHLTTLNGVIGGVVNNITVDKGFTAAEMLRLLKRFGDFDPNKLATMTLPTTAAVVHAADGDADVLLPAKDPDQQVIDVFLGVQHQYGPAPGAPGSTVPPVAPASVRVRVLNGSGRAMEATTVTEDLRKAGFQTGPPGDADTSRYATTVIRYAPGDLAKAQKLQSVVIGGAQLQPDPTLAGSGLVLVTGTSYGGITSAAVAPATPAPATAPPVTAPAPDLAQLARAFPGDHGFDPPPAGSGC